MAEHYNEFDKVRKSYGIDDAQIDALADASFHINKGEFFVLLGSSGAGNTNLRLKRYQKAGTKSLDDGFCTVLLPPAVLSLS